ELRFGPLEQRHQGRTVERMARREVELARHASELVPRAYELAVIAAVNAVADRFAKFDRDGSAQLDCQVGDASSRVELERCDDRLCRADVDARAARAAMFRSRLVDRQGQGGQNLPE